MKPGDRLTTRYRISSKISKGGMGETYLAEDDGLYGKVVVKIPIFGISSPELMKRFAREVRIHARLAHPHIVKILAADLNNDPPFYVMEYCGNGNLIENATRSSFLEAAQLILQVLSAVQHAHEKGIVHRDLKPDNILINDEGKVRVTDFGLARFLNRDTTTITSTNIGLGTLKYMAPEQVRGAKEADQLSDVYSLGLITCEVFTGVLPPLHNNTLLSSFGEVDNTLRWKVFEIVNRATEQVAGKRYSSVAMMVEDVRGLLENEPARLPEGLGVLKPEQLGRAMREISPSQLRTLRNIINGSVEWAEFRSSEENLEYDLVKTLIDWRLVSGHVVSGVASDGDEIGGYYSLVPTVYGQIVHEAIEGLMRNEEGRVLLAKDRDSTDTRTASRVADELRGGQP